jgi:hypothetical protein
MNITITFDPTKETDLTQLADALRKSGVFDLIRKNNIARVNAMAISALSNRELYGHLDYKITDALAKANITTVEKFQRYVQTGKQKKIPGITDGTMERIQATLFYAYTAL